VNTVQAQRQLAPDRAAFRFIERLRTELRPTDRILLGNEYHPIIVVESGLAWERFHRPTYDVQGRIDAAQIERLITQWQPTLICFDRSEMELGRALSLADADEQVVFGRPYRLLWREDRWTVFRFAGDGS